MSNDNPAAQIYVMGADGLNGTLAPSCLAGLLSLGTAEGVGVLTPSGVKKRNTFRQRTVHKSKYSYLTPIDMTTDNFFITRKPRNEFLSTIVDYYFHIDVSASQLSLKPEFIIPFPRITFGYFFNHPFTVTNLTLSESVSVNMAISRISTNKIVVRPQTDRVKIIGAHVRPFCLAYLTMESVKTLPWLINTKELFQNAADEFQWRIEQCSNAEQMFDEVEKVFLDHILIRDLSLITTAIDLIEKSSGSIKIPELSAYLDVSDRTLRNQFYDCIGCSPKEYIRLVKLRQVAFQMRHSEKSLTQITYDNNYFDQAHFIHEVKRITGRSPNELRKEIPDFRFLQF